MKYIINKGMAGLGNRLQSLGLALDKALEYGADLAVDWTDPSWRLGFSPYFSIEHKKITLRDLADIPDSTVVKPGSWGKYWKIPAGGCGRGVKGIKTQSKTVSTDCDGCVICCYKARHGSLLYKVLKPSKEVMNKKKDILKELNAAVYDVYHIRHTDKTTENWEDRIREARRKQSRTGIPVLILTDSLTVQDRALDNGLKSPSWILEPDRLGGVHHKKVDDKTKHRINLSAAADLWTAAGSREFTACCPDSTFSLFAERKRGPEYKRAHNT